MDFNIAEGKPGSLPALRSGGGHVGLALDVPGDPIAQALQRASFSPSKSTQVRSMASHSFSVGQQPVRFSNASIIIIDLLPCFFALLCHHRGAAGVRLPTAPIGVGQRVPWPGPPLFLLVDRHRFELFDQLIHVFAASDQFKQLAFRIPVPAFQ